VAPPLAAPLLHRLLPVSLPPGPYPLALAEAAAAGLLATLAFALLPLAAIGRIMPGALFRDGVAPARRRIAPAAAAATALAALGLAGLVVATAAERTTALWYLAGIAAAFAAFRLLGLAIEGAARRLGRVRRIAARPVLRLALANLCRPGSPAARAVLSLGIGLSVLAAVALVEGNLAAAIDTRLAEGAPSDFVIDIQPDQLAGFVATVDGVPGARVRTVPMLRGRITRLNGVPVERAAIAPEAQWAVRGDRGLTYAAGLPAGSELAEGNWWPADYKGPPLISFDEALARGMGLKIGDTLTVNLLGREITGRIANLRHIEWARLGINFAIVFAPGTLEAAPQTHLAAIYAEPAAAETVVRRAGAQFPNITAIPVREALARVERVIAAIAAALRLVALVTLAAGVLVLGGALAAGHRRRVYDAVVLKVLGATRGTVALAFLVEHGLAGAAAAAAAALVGSIAAYFIVTGPMRSDWVFLALPLAATLALALAIALVLGFAGTWRALGARPAPLLRHD
jgi:putative ABC transport system permease protein